MAAENPTWGEERIANELRLKLAIRVSPRTVQKYLAGGGRPGHKPDPSQRWLTFVRNHAQAIVACDFLVVVTARFGVLYVFVLMELGRRKILHHNVWSANPIKPICRPDAADTPRLWTGGLFEVSPGRWRSHEKLDAAIGY